MGIPNADRAVVDVRKLVAYCLDPEHEVGKHKAAVFSRVLGLDQSNANELVAALISAVQNSESVPGRLDNHGQRYVVDFKLSRGGRTATIRSVWIVDTGSDHARLITCFVL